MNSRHITDLLVQFQNKSIDLQKFNSGIIIDVALNCFYFKKNKKKKQKLQEIQNKILEAHFKKESAQEREEKKLYAELRQKKANIESFHKQVQQKKEELLNSLISQKEVTIYSEHTNNTYIPPKNISLALNFHLNNFKQYRKYHSISGAEITYKNPSLTNPKKDKIIVQYSEPPFIIEEENDLLILNHTEAEKKEIIQKIKEEDKAELTQLINHDEDDILFYPEKLEKEQDIKKSQRWLSEINDEEINNNFNNMIEYRKDNKSLDNNNDFYYDIDYSTSEFNPGSIFDDIPQIESDRYKKFCEYLSDKSYKLYMKKMNYNYLDLMLLTYFDLQTEFQKYDFIEKEKIALYFIKKMILTYGICISKIYQQLIKAIIGKKGNFSFENYIECFNPILEASGNNQILKYKLLLNLVINHKKGILTMENYKVFCTLIKGKSIYDEQLYRKLSKNMVELFKVKFPKDYTDNFKSYKITSIVECLVDGDNMPKK